MKKLFLFISILAVMLVSCSKENSLPTTTSAAVKVYEQYADRDNLTLALIGNYQKDGNTYNALMIQAQNDQAWDSLLAEFVPGSITQGETVSSLEVSSLNIDGISDDASSYYSEIADSLIGAIPLSEENYSVSVSKTYQNGILVDEATHVLTGDDVDTLSRRNLDVASIEDGQTGYVVHVESNQRAIWILFYSNRNEYNAIINNITTNNTSNEKSH